MQAIIDADTQADMDESGDRQAEAARQRETGWQWQGQRGRLADSPQAGRKAVDGKEEEASRQ
jgi:hypothetical protein